MGKFLGVAYSSIFIFVATTLWVEDGGGGGGGGGQIFKERGTSLEANFKVNSVYFDIV